MLERTVTLQQLREGIRVDCNSVHRLTVLTKKRATPEPAAGGPTDARQGPGAPETHPDAEE